MSVKNKRFAKEAAVVCAILLLLAGLLFCCRKKAADPETAEHTVQSLNGNFSCTANISYNGIEAVANINKTGKGLFSVALESPKLLKGMTFTYGDDGMHISYLGMDFTLDQDSVLATAISNALVNTFNGAASEAGMEVEEKGDSLMISGKSDSGAYKLYLDKKTGAPTRLEIPSIGLDCDFSKFKQEAEK